MYYKTCPNCGAHLDPREHCECSKKESNCPDRETPDELSREKLLKLLLLLPEDRMRKAEAFIRYAIEDGGGADGTRISAEQRERVRLAWAAFDAPKRAVWLTSVFMSGMLRD